MGASWPFSTPHSESWPISRHSQKAFCSKIVRISSEIKVSFNSMFWRTVHHVRQIVCYHHSGKPLLSFLTNRKGSKFQRAEMELKGINDNRNGCVNGNAWVLAQSRICSSACAIRIASIGEIFSWEDWMLPNDDEKSTNNTNGPLCTHLHALHRALSQGHQSTSSTLFPIPDPFE
jgi:hypothetical protein